jgi:metallophosphoesterase (TIGR00282 family)
MKILCLGDIVGKPGRKALEILLPAFVRERGVDLVVANAENVAGGSGMTEPMFSRLRHHGVDAITMGDHVYKRREVYPLLQESDRIVRPANLPPEAVGRSFSIVRTAAGIDVAFFCLLGRLYMRPADCPFHAADRVLGEIAALPSQPKVVVVDVHAEATSEKLALANHLAGRVSVVFGTHTHIPTADEQIIGGHAAYITDTGMTGPYDSILGRDKSAVLSAMITGMPVPFDVAEGDVRMSGILAQVDPATGAASGVERVQVRLSQENA